MSRISYSLISLLLPLSLLSQNDFKVYWEDGFKFESAEKKFNLNFGGRIHYDMAWMWQDESIVNAFGEFTNGIELRRARFYNSGTIYSKVAYRLQLEFAGGEVSFTDAYFELRKLPLLGNLRLGQVKEPYRLEALASSNDMPFIERTPHVAFGSIRNSGILVLNSLWNDNLGYQIGVFRNADKTGNDKTAGEAYNFTARLSAKLLNNEARNSFLHLAVAFSNRNYKNNEYRVSAGPAINLAPKYLSTGTLTNVDNVQMLNFEGAWITGPFAIQAEYLMAEVRSSIDINLSTYYAQASYFLTGESRRWKGSYEVYGGVKPRKNFGEGGVGAWEVALRFSSTDLNDRVIAGGKMTEWTTGINWYLNPASRLQLNYVLANVDEIGWSHGLLTRFHVAF